MILISSAFFIFAFNLRSGYKNKKTVEYILTFIYRSVKQKIWFQYGLQIWFNCGFAIGDSRNFQLHIRYHFFRNPLPSCYDAFPLFCTQSYFTQFCLYGSLCVDVSLRVRAFFHKTVRVCHVYCNFKIGFTCWITVIFGTLKDGSLLINTLASNICFSYRNMFENGVDALSKIVDAFWQKAQNFI